jgi:hypothetical protein
VREEKVGGKKSTGIFIKVRKKYEKVREKIYKKVREKNEKSTKKELRGKVRKKKSTGKKYEQKNT